MVDYRVEKFRVSGKRAQPVLQRVNTTLNLVWLVALHTVDKWLRNLRQIIKQMFQLRGHKAADLISPLYVVDFIFLLQEGFD